MTQTMEMVPVTVRPSLFDLETKTHYMPTGYTVEEYLSRYPEQLPAEFWHIGVIALDGEIIPRHMWRRVKIKRGKCICICLVPHGGGSGGGAKTALTVIGAIALIAATAWIGGGALVPLFGAAFAQGATGALLASAAVGIAGSIALSALAPPPLMPKNKALAQGGNGAGNQLKFASIQANLLEPLQTIPTVLGLIQASPPHLVRPYTKMVNDKLTAYACVGFAGFLDITSIRLNGVDIATFDRVTSHTSEVGGALTLAIENCWENQPNDVLTKHRTDSEDDNGVLLEDQTTPTNSCPQYHYYRTFGIPGGGAAEGVRIRLAFPSGIYQVQPTTGDLFRATVYVRIEIRRVGQVSWSLLPVLAFQASGVVPFRSEITLRWDGTSGTLAAETGTSTGSRNYDAYGRLGIAKAWVEACHADYVVDATNAVKNVERVSTTDWLIHVLESTAAHALSNEFEIRIKRGFHHAVTAAIEETSNFFGSVVDGTDDVIDSIGSTAANQIRSPVEVIVESVATIRSGASLDPTDLSYIEIEAVETAIESITATWETKAGNWGGASWGAVEASNTINVASLFRHVLINTRLNAEPLDSSLLEDDASGDSLVDWYTAANAASPDLSCNMVVDGMSVEQVLQIIAACGHAAVRRSDRWGVIYEFDRSALPIKQMFSPRNTWNNSVKILFPDPPVDALFATYLDSTDDYAPNELTIVQNIGGANIEAIEYPGIVSSTRITERARLDLRQRKFRNKFYTFTTDAQILVIQRGDLVGYSYDVLESVRQSFRIVSVNLDGSGNMVGINVDEEVFLNNFFGQNVGVVMTRLDGTVTQKQVSMSGITATSPSVKTLVFSSTLAGPITQSDFVGAHCMLGVLNSEYRRCLVFDIQFDVDLNATVALVDEAASSIHPLSA